ncbi:MAG: hypothetical protein HY674_02185 [Chloroflexi bacterium]|nr:hypothetical protein [Chloroflexota bacterium]
MKTIKTLLSIPAGCTVCSWMFLLLGAPIPGLLTEQAVRKMDQGMNSHKKAQEDAKVRTLALFALSCGNFGKAKAPSILRPEQ